MDAVVLKSWREIMRHVMTAHYMWTLHCKLACTQCRSKHGLIHFLWFHAGSTELDMRTTIRHGDHGYISTAILILWLDHYSDVIMSTMPSQITCLTIIYSIVYSGADQRKHQSSASLAFEGNSLVTDKFPAQRASNAENVSIWWCHHVIAWKFFIDA